MLGADLVLDFGTVLCKISYRVSGDNKSAMYRFSFGIVKYISFPAERARCEYQRFCLGINADTMCEIT